MDRQIPRTDFADMADAERKDQFLKRDISFIINSLE